ncbi:MAG: hypothetical protein SH819_12305 [Cytophagales bacterium]|nr:hypothetical protein [Cytophagales bacterium]
MGKTSASAPPTGVKPALYSRKSRYVKSGGDSLKRVVHHLITRNLLWDSDPGSKQGKNLRQNGPVSLYGKRLTCLYGVRIEDDHIGIA